MEKEKSSISNGISFTSLLTLAFIVLKLCNVIKWSWWWVLSPIWLSVASTVVLAIAYIAVLLFKRKLNKKK
jgi:membrane protein YdbS with pleckstrin-like domain